MTRLVLFRDFDPYYKVDDSGFNKIGVILDDNTVIHPRLSRMTKTSLSKIKSRKHATLDLSESAGFSPDKISSFFNGNILNSELINAAHEALVKGDVDFFECPIKLPILTGAANETFEERWLEFVKRLRPGDLIMTFDTRSPISRFIAWIDQGTWSHVGCYAGNGRIIEAVTAGVLERNIEVYHSPRFRLAIYRIDPPPPPDDIEKQLFFARSQIGKKYNYYGALRLGVRKILGNQWQRNKPGDFGPNDLALNRSIKLEFIV